MIHNLLSNFEYFSKNTLFKLSDFKEQEELINIGLEIERKIERFEKEEQQLSIGIMGQVKAGKSTFLNALLFDGKPILPEAATPKTANLTRITYGEKPELKVEYYTPEEWQIIEQNSQSSDLSDTTKVAKELTALAADADINISDILERREETIQAETTEQLLDNLNSYVGNDGQFTPLVKMTHLFLPLDELKGYEVVDTPGMNDPVQSRTQKTRDYMSQCDVVFFLSRSSQFLDQSDMDLLSHQLPGKGVKRMELVACQFDSAIWDDGYDRDSLAETEENLKKRLSRVASEKMSTLSEQKDQPGKAHIANMLRHMATPIFSSTFAQGFSHWPEDQWGKSMKHAFGELTEMAEDEWDGYKFTQQDWIRIANFDTLTAAYEAARADRQKILAEQKARIIPDALQQLDERMERLKAAVSNRRDMLQTNDVNKLQKQQQNCESRINAIEDKLAQHINQVIDKAQTAAFDLQRSLKSSISSHSKLTTRTGTETHVESYEVDTSTWYNPFSWGSTKTVYQTVTTSYEYLTAADAVEQLREYAIASELEVERQFNSLIRPDQLKTDLKQTLLNELNTQSDDFSPQQFSSIIRNSLDRIKIPGLKLDTRDLTSVIGQNFSGEIRDRDQMDRLRSSQYEALSQIYSYLDKTFKTSSEQLFSQLKDLRDNLKDQLTDDIRTELAKLREDFKDKEKQLNHYQALEAELQSAQEEFRTKFSA